MWGYLIGAIGGLFVGVAVVYLVKITIDNVFQWITQSKKIDSQYAVVIKEKIDNGEYKIVSGVFNGANECTSAQTWTAQTIDGDFHNLFEGSNQVILTF